MSDDPRRSRPLGRARQRQLLFILGIGVVLVIAYFVFFTGGGLVSTDNAYLKSNRVAISAEIDGRLAEIHVVENEFVEKGDPLFDLDAEPYRIAIRRLEAAIQDRENEIRALRARYRETGARLDRGREALSFARRELERVERLASQDLASASQLDEVRHNHEQARQAVEVIKQERSALLEELGGDAEVSPTRHPRYLAVMAELEQARLDLAHARVRAPANGLVTQLERFRPGEYVRAGDALFSLVETDSVWLEANLKETELENVRPGQPVTIEVDAYPGRELEGRVASIGAATGSEFSILPPQNATGNWIKVTQRIPVRVELLEREKSPPLRLGMSARAIIDTRQNPPARTAESGVRIPAGNPP